MDHLIVSSSNLSLRFEDPFMLEVHIPTSLCPLSPPLFSPTAIFPHRSASESTTEHFYNPQHQLSYTFHSQIYRTIQRPHSPAFPTAISTTVHAHIETHSRSTRTRTRVTFSGRPRLRDVVRQLLGHGPEARCSVSIRNQGAWQDANLEVRLGGSETEVEIRIVTGVEERRVRGERRWSERDGSRERVFVERWG